MIGAACDTGPLPVLLCRCCASDWMLPPGFGGSMKQLQPREASPLWVWLSIVLIGFGALAYFTGYLLIEEIIAFLK